jgi:hypothetical protein
MPGPAEEMAAAPADGVDEYTGAMHCAYRTPLYRPSAGTRRLTAWLGYIKFVLEQASGKGEQPKAVSCVADNGGEEDRMSLCWPESR